MTLPFRRARSLMTLMTMLALCWPAQAAPTGPQVTAGRATFARQGSVFSITNTPGTIINWQSFNIGAGETARFIQQNSDSAVLNRVTGQDPSKILGALQSNGKVVLINPNGILFGQGARVDVNGLVAASLNLTDADFLAGRKRFQAGSASPGAVRNDGAITTPAGGQVLLLAPQVGNSGIVSAPGGDVMLAAGHTVQLVDSADPDVQVVLSAPAHAAVNLGRVIAAGGRVGIYGALVAQRGLVSADSAVVGANGKIVLKASGTATLAPGSVTRAVGSGGADGGTVEVLGAAVAVERGAQVDASGRNGGTVLVGGDWQGGGTAAHAQRTTLASGAVIRADAADDGNGGKVVLWSDGATVARGRISARGAGGGAGGQVETSGHVLDVDGMAVDAAGGGVAGNAGRNGTWLLDPYDVQVVNGGTAGAGAVAVDDPDSKSGVTRVAPATLTANGTDIVLKAQHDLTVTDALDAAGSVFAQAGHDIAIDAAVGTRSTAAGLTFLAGNAFTLGAGATLRTGNAIYIEANRIDLAGSIAGANGRLPQLGISSADVALPIRIGTPTSADAGAALVLDPRVLNRLGGSLYELDLGNDKHTGTIAIDAALNLAANLALTNRGDVAVRAPVDLGGSATSRFQTIVDGGGTLDLAGSITAAKSVLIESDGLALDGTIAVPGGDVTIRPGGGNARIGIGANTGDFVIGAAALGALQAKTLTIGRPGAGGGIGVEGAVALAGVGVLTLDAGNGPLALAAPLATGRTLVLASTDTIAESGAGTITAGALALRGGTVALAGANAIGTLAGTGTGGFAVTAQGALDVGTVAGLSGIDAGSVVLDAAGIGGSGIVRAAALTLRSSAGIGSRAAPLHTRTGTLAARNGGAGGAAIDIVNDGDLASLLALQEGGGAGAVRIETTGALAVPDIVAGSEVSTGSGDIDLIAHGALAIGGQVTTTSGNVRLRADGLLTIGPTGRVTSVGGRVARTAAAEQIAPGTIRDADAGPTPAACLAAPLALGCGQVLDAAARACAANAGNAACAGVYAGLAALCAARPGDAGCAVIKDGGGAAGGEGVQLAQAQQAAVQLINTGTQGVMAPPGQRGGGAQEAGERTPGPARAGLQEAGAKHDKPATKMYCN